MEFKIIGKILIAVGIILIVFGTIFLSGIKLPLGRLPGDIAVHKKGFHLYFPVTTCILLSIIISFILWLFFRR